MPSSHFREHPLHGIFFTINDNQAEILIWQNTQCPWTHVPEHQVQYIKQPALSAAALFSVDQCHCSLSTIRLINVNVSTASKWSDHLLRRLDRLIWWPEKNWLAWFVHIHNYHFCLFYSKIFFASLQIPNPNFCLFIGSLPCCWTQWLQCWQPSTFNSFATFLNFQVSLDNVSCTWMCNAQRTLNAFCATLATCARLEHVVSFRQRGACSVCHRVCHKKWRCHNCQRGGKCNNVTPRVTHSSFGLIIAWAHKPSDCRVSQNDFHSFIHICHFYHSFLPLVYWTQHSDLSSIC